MYAADPVVPVRPSLFGSPLIATAWQALLLPFRSVVGSGSTAGSADGKPATKPSQGSAPTSSGNNTTQTHSLPVESQGNGNVGTRKDEDTPAGHGHGHGHGNLDSVSPYGASPSVGTPLLPEALMEPVMNAGGRHMGGGQEGEEEEVWLVPRRLGRTGSLGPDPDNLRELALARTDLETTARSGRDVSVGTEDSHESSVTTTAPSRSSWYSPRLPLEQSPWSSLAHLPPTPMVRSSKRTFPDVAGGEEILDRATSHDNAVSRTGDVGRKHVTFSAEESVQPADVSSQTRASLSATPTASASKRSLQAAGWSAEEER